jgi:hypothetical protein
MPTSLEGPAPARASARSARPAASVRFAPAAVNAQGLAAPRPKPRMLTRPPCVTAGQLLRVAALLLAGMVYADFPRLSLAWTKSRVPSPIAAAKGVDLTPTASIASKAPLAAQARP